MLRIKRIIDLSQNIDSGKYNNPLAPVPKMHICATHDKNGWMAETIFTGLHSGTHIDAPIHKIKNGKTIADYPLQRFHGYGVVVDLFNKEPGSEITAKDLYKYKKVLKANDIVLLCTGWGNKEKFKEPNDYIYKSPWLGESACDFLIESKVNAVGIDHFSIGGMDERNVLVIHEKLLAADILIFEDLFLPEILLEKQKWYIFAFPVFTGNTSGSFARIVALDFG